MPRSLLGCAVVLLAGAIQAGDWPQYRGANNDGVSAEIIRTNWSAEAPRQVWKTPLDPALSSLAISGGRVFTMVRRPVGGQNQEFCIALNADSGAEIWASSSLGIARYPDGGAGSDDGPRSTPSVSGDRVFVLTSYLRLYCLNGAIGQVMWSKDLVTEYGGVVISWQNAASPLLVEDLVLVNSNGRPGERLIAFRKGDGSEAWKGQSDAMTHSTPARASIAGVDQVVFLAQSGLVSVAPATGAVLWRYAFSYNGVSTAASPVIGSDIVYCSAAYGTGAGAARITGSGSDLAATEAWRKTGDLQNHWCTPVQVNGHLYGMYGQSVLSFKCVELATGTEKWSVDNPYFGYGSALAVGGNILALSDSGELVLVAPNPAAYTEITRFRALTGKCWNAPALSNGRIYVRSTTEAVCLDVAANTSPPPPIKLQSLFASDDGLFRLLIGNEDGSPIDSNRVANIELFATMNVAAGAAEWIRLTNSIVLTNGQLRLDDPGSRTQPQRFFRVEERP
jgi:outer membrane protein assembly factor BamB